MKKVMLTLVVMSALVPQTGFAQSRPLVTEDPETVPMGNILFEAGFDYAQSVVFPASG